AAVVVRPGRLRSGLRKVFDQADQWRRAFGQIAYLGGPVVHFQVDVDRVFAAPWWHDGFIPNALQVCGLTTGAAAGHQKVAAELKSERLKIRIPATCPNSFQTVIGRFLV